MKYITTVTAVCWLVVGTLFAQTPIRMEKAGLLSELAYIKHVAEFHATTALQDPRPISLGILQTRPEKVSRDEYKFLVDSMTNSIKETRRISALPVVQAYLELKVLSDQWLTQIQGDIRRKNKNKAYKELDDVLKAQALSTAKVNATPDSRLFYLGKIDDELIALNAAVSSYLGGGQQAAFGDIEIPGAGTVVDIFAGIAERRKGKADALVELLESMRLVPLSDLLPGAKGKD
ncbi:MAG TPA: hypothetical protein PKN30_15685 [Flavobacteriales bacterium]|nr:hypothetical protein [Flavobacteriales bacterium]